MSRIAWLIERTLGMDALDPPGPTTAPPEVVAVAALVRACVCESILARRVAEAQSLEEVLDCLAADRLLIVTALSIDPDVLRDAPPGDLVRAVLDVIAGEPRAPAGAPHSG